MKIVEPSYKILTYTSEDGIMELQHIERVGRVCYKSEDKISQDGESAKRFVRMLISRGHEAILEHSCLSVLFICDRGISHEIVRHRLASFAQESTRYCNYSKDKFDGEISVILPYWLKNWKDGDPTITRDYYAWKDSCQRAENRYFDLLENETPERARAVLPTSLKTELVMTANYREWRHFLKLRCAPDAHPQMRELTLPLLRDLNALIPVIFEDIYCDYYEAGGVSHV